MKTIIREMIETVIIAVLIFLLARAVAQNYGIDGPSMEPSFYTGQDTLVNRVVYFNIDLGKVRRLIPLIKSNRRIFLFHSPRYGEVVILKAPHGEVESNLIKRVVALPGDVVEIKLGKLFVNGQPREEPYISGETRGILEPLEVPPEHYFVMGDNRNNSTDSRLWGSVSVDDIVGKVWFIYWPIKDLKLVPSYSFAKQN